MTPGKALFFNFLGHFSIITLRALRKGVFFDHQIAKTCTSEGPENHFFSIFLPFFQEPSGNHVQNGSLFYQFFQKTCTLGVIFIDFQAFFLSIFQATFQLLHLEHYEKGYFLITRLQKPVPLGVIFINFQAFFLSIFQATFQLLHLEHYEMVNFLFTRLKKPVH